MTDQPSDDERDATSEDRRTVTVPKYVSGDDVVEWMEVDEEWWEHVETARAVHERVVETYGDEPGVVYVEISRGEGTIADRSTSAVTLVVSDEETAESLSVPDDIDGIPIVVRIDRISDTE